MKTIQQRMATGIVWMVGARLMDRGVGVLSTLILARLLVPEDFGVVAMATAIAGILDLLGAFSFDLALIQNKHAGKRQYDTVWTFNVLFGLFCAAALVALAIPAAVFYREPRLEAVMYTLAIPYVVGGFANIGVVNFRKDLKFRAEFNFIFFRRVITFLVTIGCAFWLRSYWALVAGIVVGRAASVQISYMMSHYRPSFTLAASRELFHFSKWLFLNNTLFFLLHSGPNFVIGRLSGALGLGIYTVAYEISNLPSSELVAPINRATFPGFSQMENNEAIAVSYLKLLGMISLLILPVGIGIAAVSEPMVLALLGDRWSAAVPLIQILAAYGAIAATQTNNGVVWMVLGRPRDVTIVTAIFLFIFFPALYFFLQAYGVLGAGYAYLVAAIATVPIGMWNTKRLLGLEWNALARVIWRPLVAAVAMFASVIGFDTMTGNYGVLPRLILESILGAVVYVTVTLTLWVVAGRSAGAESFCIDRVRAALSSLRERNV